MLQHLRFLTGLLALFLICYSGGMAQQPSDSVDRIQAVKILPLYLLAFDAQQLRLAYETGNALASWQYEFGIVLPVYQVWPEDKPRNQYGFAVQLGRRWAMGETIYLTGTAEYRLITYAFEEFIGQGCEDGSCDYMQLFEKRQFVHSPTVHLLLGKRLTRSGNKTFVDLEAGVGYKWAFRREEDGDDFFLFDMQNGTSAIERKFNLRLNLNIGFNL